MKEINIPLIDRRVIEAQAVGPIIRALAQRLGLDQAKALLQEVNERIAWGNGQALAQKIASEGRVNDLTNLAQEMSTWPQGGVLEEEVLEQTPRTYFFNVTRCQYAERYAELGLADLGTCLSCCRDEPFTRGFNPKITMTRTQTIMEGGTFCDFRYRLED